MPNVGDMLSSYIRKEEHSGCKNRSWECVVLYIVMVWRVVVWYIVLF